MISFNRPLSLIILLGFMSQTLLGIAPPKPGIVLPSSFRENQRKFAGSYTVSGLAKSIQYRKNETIRLTRDQRFDQAEVRQMVTTNYGIPVLLGEYSNSTAIFPQADIQSLLFGTNPTGSMVDYFSEVSYGQFSLSGATSDWKKLPNDQAYYVGADNGGDGEAARFCYDLAELNDPTVDFSLYDNDGPDG